MHLIRTTWLIFHAQLFRTLRSKRTLVCAAIAILPILLAFVVSLFLELEDPRALARAPRALGWMLIVQVVVPVLSLIAGAAVVSEEIEDRTITYLLTRPIPRASILVGRWLACVVWLELLVGVSLSGSLLALGWKPLDAEAGNVPAELAHALFAAALCGGVIYSTVFAALGTRIKHPMIVGLIYTFAIELFLSNLPGKTQTLTVMFYLKSIARSIAPDAWGRMPMFRGDHFDTLPEALTTLAILVAVSLFLGSWILSRRQYVMSS